MKLLLQSSKWAFVGLWLLQMYVAEAQTPVFRRHEPGVVFPEMKLKLACEDRNGYLWIGTGEGLLRFDGLHFERPLDSVLSSLNGKVSAMYRDRKGALWAGFEDGSIAYSDPIGRWRLWDLEEGFPASAITGFAESTDGLFWVATYGEGLYYYNGKHLNNISSDDGFPSDDVYSLAAAANGKVWAGTDGGIAVCSIQEGKKRVTLLTTAQGLPDAIVTVLLPDRQGNFWVGMHDGGIAYYHTALETFFCMEQPWTYGVVSAMALLEGRELWIGTDDSGLLRYSLNGGQLDWINGPGGLPRSKISGLYTSNEGHLRVMTNERGFYSANLQFAVLEGLQGNVQAVLADSRNRLWAGTPTGLWMSDLAAQGARGFSPHTFHQELNIISLYEDDPGNIWIGTFGQGLYIKPADGGKWVHFDEQSGLSNNSILDIEGRGNRIWMATLGGVTEFELRGDITRSSPVRIRNYQKENGLGTNFIYSVFADSGGRIWFGTDGKGISVLERGVIKNYSFAITATKDTFPLHTIYSFAEDEKGHLWFTTAKDGLFSFDGQYFRRYNYADGLQRKGIACIERDASGLLLLAHHNGIDLLDPASGQFFHFEEGAGIEAFEPNLNAISNSSEGYIWIGTQQGAMRYTPFGRQRSAYPKTVLERVDVFLESVDFQSKSVFRPNENNLVFRFAGLWYTDPGRIRYRHRLLGFNNDWIYSADRQATYPNLPPGRYTFEVSAGLDDVFEPSQSVRYSFRIRAPFWSRWWFILCVLAVASAAFARWIRYREERLRREAMVKKEQIESRFEVLKSQINPHFLFNSFNTLASIIEEDPTLAVRYVERLSDFFRNIIQYRDKELIPLEEELIILRNYVFLLEKRFGQNIDLQLDVQPIEGFIAPLTLQLLVENAVKHNIISGSKPLRIVISVHDGFLVVENNLQPRLSPAESTGMGLRNIIRRYELLSNTPVMVEKSSTFFSVRIPLIQTEMP